MSQRGVLAIADRKEMVYIETVFTRCRCNMRLCMVMRFCMGLVHICVSDANNAEVRGLGHTCVSHAKYAFAWVCANKN